MEAVISLPLADCSRLERTRATRCVTSCPITESAAQRARTARASNSKASMGLAATAPNAHLYGGNSHDAVLYLQDPPGHPGLAALLDMAGMDRIVVHQATGMIAAQLDATPADALARLRATAFQSGRSIYDIAQDVVERRVRLDG